MLYDRFSSRVFGLGMVMLGNRQAAQDLVQDTFVKLWRTAARFDPERGRLETWVLLTARSLAIDILRRRVLESDRCSSSDRRRCAIRPRRRPGCRRRHGGARSPSDDHAQPRATKALELAYFGGRTTAEVAALDGIPQGTVKTRIHAALLRLRAEMAKEVDDDV